MIQVENLSKKFANVQAFKDISFKVERGIPEKLPKKIEKVDF